LNDNITWISSRCLVGGALESDEFSVLHPGFDVDNDRFLLLADGTSFAFPTAILLIDHFTLPLTLRTDDDLSAEHSRPHLNGLDPLTLTAAAGAASARFALHAAAAATVGTKNVPFDLKCDLFAVVEILESDTHSMFDIRGSLAALSPPTSEGTHPATEKMGKDIVEAAAATLTKALNPETVVYLATMRILQNFVGFVHLLKFLSRIRISAFVRVILSGQVLERFLQLTVTHLGLHTQNVVQLRVDHHRVSNECEKSGGKKRPTTFSPWQCRRQRNPPDTTNTKPFGTD
jgi:hypothetical protein